MMGGPTNIPRRQGDDWPAAATGSGDDDFVRTVSELYDGVVSAGPVPGSAGELHLDDLFVDRSDQEEPEPAEIPKIGSEALSRTGATSARLRDLLAAPGVRNALHALIPAVIALLVIITCAPASPFGVRVVVGALVAVAAVVVAFRRGTTTAWFIELAAISGLLATMGWYFPPLLGAGAVVLWVYRNELPL